EFDHPGNRRTNVFYCDPAAAFQKGAIENNHEMIRRIIPKGQSLDDFTQEDIRRMMNHINSYGRKNLGGKSPYAVFASLHGEETLRRMGAIPIPHDEVTLRPSLLKTQ
ncbi:MAG TPA: IS30 family transposase, partial [Peptococcaceae bacterium]|nr:IS30 family transposase [Peptococcaceae bacterium]